MTDFSLMAARASQAAEGLARGRDGLLRSVVREGTSRSSCDLLSGSRPAGLGQGDPECLEDRLENVLGILALDQPDVQRQAGAGGELAKEVGDEIGSEPADARLREVDV